MKVVAFLAIVNASTHRVTVCNYRWCQKCKTVFNQDELGFETNWLFYLCEFIGNRIEIEVTVEMSTLCEIEAMGYPG